MSMFFYELSNGKALFGEKGESRENSCSSVLE